ncbi:cyclophilin-like fold protein [Companilactobacillus jidongensis]|uniref:cyclophilin-like fold protein n=1 Tax=Companilactobacillus jidongensis TaxID=2486006 RepID=UPI000F76B86B|nr:cyclophilin-like fold protein [Companilactobacillus jidongensis]
MKTVNLIFNDKKLEANFFDNDTSIALLNKLTLKISMINLYSREMTYRFPEALPAKKAKTSGYEVGDIAYWTPRHSLVIFYKQTGEIIDNLQIVGHIKSGVEIFKSLGNTEIEFQLSEEE